MTELEPSGADLEALCPDAETDEILRSIRAKDDELLRSIHADIDRMNAEMDELFQSPPKRRTRKGFSKRSSRFNPRPFSNIDPFKNIDTFKDRNPFGNTRQRKRKRVSRRSNRLNPPPLETRPLSPSSPVPVPGTGNGPDDVGSGNTQK